MVVHEKKSELDDENMENQDPTVPKPFSLESILFFYDKHDVSRLTKIPYVILVYGTPEFI